MIIPIRLAFLLSFPIVVNAASNTSLEKEYQQVRTIALRDPKVQKAYQDADKRLEAKVLQIDPSLESYLKQRQTPKPATASKATKPQKTSVKTHKVVAGETFASIASAHGVIVAVLKEVNAVKDERKLRVGQGIEHSILSEKESLATKSLLSVGVQNSTQGQSTALYLRASS